MIQKKKTSLKAKLFFVIQFHLSGNCIRSTLTREGNRVVQTAQLNTNLIQNTSTETPTLIFDQLAGHCVGQSG